MSWLKSRSMVLRRTPYFISIGVLFFLKLAALVFFATFVNWSGWLKNIDTGIAVGLALAAGARFADIGWPRWVAYVAVLLLMIAVPVALLFASDWPRVAQAVNPIDAMPDVLYVSTALTLTFFILIGLKKSSPGAGPEDKAAPLVSEHIDPRF